MRAAKPVFLVSYCQRLEGTRKKELAMGTIKTRFSRKLHMAFGAMLAITLALAWYFYDSVQWFEYDVKRIAEANSALNGHRALKAHTEERLRLINESIAQGASVEPKEWLDNETIIRNTIDAIRQGYSDDTTLRNPGQKKVLLDALRELESLTGKIIESGDLIRVALQTGAIDTAEIHYRELEEQGTVQLFKVMMEERLASDIKAVDDANRESISLSNYITRVLPLFMLALAGLTGLVVWLFSRSLTRSVNVLHHGAKAFSVGDLSYHIPELREKEFDRLGEAFNTMAHELAIHRTSMHDSQVRLEAMVEERTRALKRNNEILAMVDENRRKLLADISHEFRTPLTVIRGEAEIAMRGKAKTKAEYIETLQRIMDQADQTTRLVDDLLFMARADAGEPSLKVRPVTVGSLLTRVCADFAATAKKKKVGIEQPLAFENAVVMGDSGRLRQVFSILMDNALRYSKEGGTVEVELKRDESDVVVTVTDNGIGLTKEEARQAFQRFYRGGKAQGHARGTGLGLPVAKAIIEAHKGSISLEGEPGKGAVATIVLPVEDKLKAVA